MKAKVKDTVVDFVSNLVAVILGIVITFTIQGMIDRAADRKDVRSALELVRTELEANRSDITTMTAYLEQERDAAQYFIDHRGDLAACPADTVALLGGLLFADASISVSSDALELLKNSALFPKIGNNGLSMNIIRAYDTCASIVSGMNHHLAARDARFEQTAEFLGSAEGLSALHWLSAQADPSTYADVSDINAALEAVDNYLHGKKR